MASPATALLPPPVREDYSDSTHISICNSLHVLNLDEPDSLLRGVFKNVMERLWSPGGADSVALGTSELDEFQTGHAVTSLSMSSDQQITFRVYSVNEKGHLLVRRL